MFTHITNKSKNNIRKKMTAYFSQSSNFVKNLGKSIKMAIISIADDF